MLGGLILHTSAGIVKVASSEVSSGGIQQGRPVAECTHFSGLRLRGNASHERPCMYHPQRFCRDIALPMSSLPSSPRGTLASPFEATLSMGRRPIYEPSSQCAMLCSLHRNTTSPSNGESHLLVRLARVVQPPKINQKQLLFAVGCRLS